VRIFKKLNTLRTPTKNQLFNAKNPKSLRASSAEFLRQPASQSGPLSALLSKENTLKRRVNKAVAEEYSVRSQFQLSQF